MWKAIEYSDEYFDKMLEMVRENYGDVEIANKDFIKWQYFDNPAGQAIINFAYNEENDELAGQYIVIPQTLKLHDNNVNCVNSLDTLTRKKYRGQKIFRDLTKITYEHCTQQGYPFIIIFPNENSKPGFLKYFDFKSICRFPILITPIKVMHPGKARLYENVVEITKNNIQLLDEFWQENKKKYNIMCVRDSKYLKWRYLDVPLREYRFLGLVKEGRLEGYIVGTIKNISGIRAGVITDMLLGDNCSNNERKALIDSVINYFDLNKARISMAFFPKHSEEYKALKKNLYIKWPGIFEPRTFEVFSLDFPENTLLNTFNAYKEGNWFTTIGDYLLV